MKNKPLALLGIISIALVSMRFNISILAWVMYVPLLILVRNINGAKSWFSVFLLLQAALFLQIVKMITEPLTIAMALLFSAPIAAGAWALFWLFEKARRKLGDLKGVFIFASLMSVSEWISFYTSDFGSWGSATYTQLDDLAFLQMTALLGITFSSFFIYLSSAFTAALLTSPDRRRLIKPAIATWLAFVLVYSYGVVRLDQPAPGQHINVAAIASDIQITPQGIPNKAYLRKGTEKLIEATKTAIGRGARLIAWNEGATIIFKEDEAGFIQRMRDISRKHDVDLVIAYIVPIDGIISFENKYILITKGKIHETYLKYHPVPGEGAIKGEKISTAANLGYARIGGAICYDFDFPGIGRALSRQGVDIAVAPSSDWRGIDPYHAKMAAVRAIEGGYALLRPARGATSIATDAFGRIRASMSYFEENDRIMLASLPAQQTPTLYSKVGDIFPIVLSLLLMITLYQFWTTKADTAIL